jgi:hypothetical protein
MGGCVFDDKEMKSENLEQTNISSIEKRDNTDDSEIFPKNKLIESENNNVVVSQNVSNNISHNIETEEVFDFDDDDIVIESNSSIENSNPENKKLNSIDNNKIEREESFEAVEDSSKLYDKVFQDSLEVSSKKKKMNLLEENNINENILKSTETNPNNLYISKGAEQNENFTSKPDSGEIVSFDNNWKVSLQWDISKYLPPLFFRPFFVIIGKFIVYASKGFFSFLMVVLCLLK